MEKIFTVRLSEDKKAVEVIDQTLLTNEGKASFAEMEHLKQRRKEQYET